jgi:hypothetical protein
MLLLLMNYKMSFEDNKAICAELVKDGKDIVDHAIVDNVRVIKPLVVNALSEVIKTCYLVMPALIFL